MDSILAMLKTDLGIKTDVYNERLTQIINSSMEMIRTEGANLDPMNFEDAQLLVMYAAWLWRRRDDGAGMPRMLRWNLNNRVFKENING